MGKNQTAIDDRSDKRGEQPTVLVVDDDEAVVEVYKHSIDDNCDVVTAYDGEQALETINESVDVVLLDRQMPNLTGGEALEEIRERGYDCRVAMVTGVDPDFDIVEMPFDAYLTKPVDEEEVRDVVEELLLLSTYDKQFQEYFRLAEKKAALETEKTTEELATNGEYADVQDRLDELKRELDALLAAGDDVDFDSAFRSPPDNDK
ncbi:DNA-binding protein [Halobacteriales archaeon QS_5_70_15]|nr:MAG: DNA-binding protein [Halobacteriales archaeon QS_5_70_15]